MSSIRAADSKLITCVLPKGCCRAVLSALKQEQGIVTANVNYARGTGRMTHRSFRKSMSQTEKEVLTVVVPADRADELFAFIFETADIGRPHGGLMYQTDLAASSMLELPDLPEES
jgi:nitrogen regulatory protein PII